MIVTDLRRAPRLPIFALYNSDHWKDILGFPVGHRSYLLRVVVV